MTMEASDVGIVGLCFFWFILVVALISTAEGPINSFLNDAFRAVGRAIERISIAMLGRRN